MSNVDDRRDYGTFIPSFLDDFGLDPFEFRLYSHIARRAGSGICWESVPAMAKVCKMDRKTAFKAFAFLQDHRMILVERRKGQTNLITLTNHSVWLPVPNKEQVEPVPNQVLPHPKSGTPPVPNQGHPPVPNQGHPPVPNQGHKGTPYEGTPNKGIPISIEAQNLQIFIDVFNNDAPEPWIKQQTIDSFTTKELLRFVNEFQGDSAQIFQNGLLEAQKDGYWNKRSLSIKNYLAKNLVFDLAQKYLSRSPEKCSASRAAEIERLMSLTGV